jgi:MFS family permease
MAHFASPGDPGVWQTFLVLAAIYLVFMLAGSIGYRIPPINWKPEGWVAPAARASIAQGQVALHRAWLTPQFWLIWTVLLMNVSAGIGVLSVASPMLQHIFGVPAAAAAGFVGLLSLFNIGGRIFWASASDWLGRKATYCLFFVLGITLYSALPLTATAGVKPLFVLACCVILSMYGGGFSTAPAYLADVFGTRFIGAIHGRLLTAWSTAGVLGPVLVSWLSETAKPNVVHGAAYDRTLYTLAGLLAIGLVTNLLVRPLSQGWFMTPRELATADGPAISAAERWSDATSGGGIGLGGFSPAVGIAWLSVMLPVAWGCWVTFSVVTSLL